VKHILLHISGSWPITLRLVHSWAGTADIESPREMREVSAVHVISRRSVVVVAESASVI